VITLRIQKSTKITFDESDDDNEVPATPSVDDEMELRRSTRKRKPSVIDLGYVPPSTVKSKKSAKKGIYRYLPLSSRYTLMSIEQSVKIAMMMTMLQRSCMPRIWK
jgi:hypothetical protein